MTNTAKNFILIGISIITITTVVSGCKSRGEVKTEQISVINDTIPPEETVDTSSATKTIVTHQPLTITIQNLKSATAPVYISVYGTKNKFPSPKGQLKEYKFKAHGMELTVEIPNLKFGTYALASYQDVNSDGKIDKNLIGIPTEGYAFSNNYKPTIKAPNFDDCSFAYNAKSNSVTMKMIQ